MTKISIDEQIKQAELDKIKAETAKIKSERKKQNYFNEHLFWMEPAKLAGAFLVGIVGFVAGILGVVSGFAQWQEKKTKVAEVEIKKEKIEENKNTEVKTLKKEIASIKNNPEKLKEFNENHLVFVQFRGNLKRELINQYRAFIKHKSFNNPGAERLSGNYQNTIKYFNNEDKAHAEKLVSLTKDFFASKDCFLDIQATPHKSKNKYSPIEVWLHHSCKWY